MAALLVLLQGALLFVAPAAVVAFEGLAHRGGGDCRGEGREAVRGPRGEQARPGGRRKGRSSAEFPGSSFFPQLQWPARTDGGALKKRDDAPGWEERGHVASTVGGPQDGHVAVQRKNPGTSQGIIPGRQAGPTPGSQSLGPRLWFNLSMWQAGVRAVYHTRGFFCLRTICFSLGETGGLGWQK